MSEKQYTIHVIDGDDNEIVAYEVSALETRFLLSPNALNLSKEEQSKIERALECIATFWMHWSREKSSLDS